MYSRSDKRRLAPLIHSHRLPRQPPTTHEMPRRANVGRVILDRSFLATNVFETEEGEEEKEKRKRRRKRRRLPRERVEEQVQQQTCVCVLRGPVVRTLERPLLTPLYAVNRIVTSLL